MAEVFVTMDGLLVVLVPHNTTCLASAQSDHFLYTNSIKPHHIDKLNSRILVGSFFWIFWENFGTNMIFVICGAILKNKR